MKNATVRLCWLLYLILGFCCAASAEDCAGLTATAVENCHGLVKLINDRPHGFDNFTGDFKREHHRARIYAGKLTLIGFPEDECERTDFSADDRLYSCGTSFGGDRSQALRLFLLVSAAAHSAAAEASNGVWQEWRKTDGETQTFRAGPGQGTYVVQVEIANFRGFSNDDDWFVYVQVFSSTRSDN